MSENTNITQNASVSTSTAGQPVAAAQSVWQSKKFRQAVYSAIVSVVSSFVAGFLAALIPKLGAEQIAGIMQWTGTTVGGTFAASIFGASYVDGQVQISQSPVAAQTAIAQAQATTTQAQTATAAAQAAVVQVVQELKRS